jgi:hypothetical protein
MRNDFFKKTFITLALVLSAICATTVYAQAPAERCKPRETPGQWSKPGNDASPCYEVNQTFDGTSFLKDNNIWTYTKDFADLFGMPVRHVEGLQGAEAVAFRIEDVGYQRCGMGGNINACQKQESCIVELYFDESKTKLPWASDRQTQWVPRDISMRWLRSLERQERPKSVFEIDSPADVVRLQWERGQWRSSQLVAFADPVTRLETVFMSNVGTDQGGDEAGSNKLLINGYFRRFYRDMSMVSLDLGCFTSARRRTIAIRLELQEARHQVTKRYQTVVLPEGFVSRIDTLYKTRNERELQFNKSLFIPPLGTKGTANTPSNTPQ